MDDCDLDHRCLVYSVAQVTGRHQDGCGSAFHGQKFEEPRGSADMLLQISDDGGDKKVCELETLKRESV